MARLGKRGKPGSFACESPFWKKTKTLTRERRPTETGSNACQKGEVVYGLQQGRNRVPKNKASDGGTCRAMPKGGNHLKRKGYQHSRSQEGNTVGSRSAGTKRRRRS